MFAVLKNLCFLASKVTIPHPLRGSSLCTKEPNCANDFFNGPGTQICNYELGTIGYNFIISFLNALQLKFAEIKAPLFNPFPKQAPLVPGSLGAEAGA